MSASKPLEGQVALVTGASRGCGRGIALQLGEAGCIVYITALRPEDEDEEIRRVADKLPTLEAVAEEITQRGGRGIPIFLDHCSSAQTRQLFERIAAEQSGRLDILVNNVYSGVTTQLRHMNQRFHEIPEEAFDRCNDAGLRGHYWCCRWAAKLMIPRRGGLIVEVGSWGGVFFLFNAAYGVNKTATDRLAADVAWELKDHNITAVALSVGMVLSELFDPAVGLIDTSKDPVVAAYWENQKKMSETVEYAGKCLVAFAADPHRHSRTGHILLSTDLAQEYNVREADGSQPYCSVIETVRPVVEVLNRSRTSVPY